MSSGTKIAYGGLFCAAALLCGYIESLFPFSFGIPGIKLGLANAVVVLLLFAWNLPMAVTVSLVRILLSGLLFGNGASLLYSLAGGVFSLAVMAVLHRCGVRSPVPVSAIGGVTHNIGQLLMAALLLKSSAVWFYLPALVAAGAVTGVLIGVICSLLIPRVAPLLKV